MHQAAFDPSLRDQRAPHVHVAEPPGDSAEETEPRQAAPTPGEHRAAAEFAGIAIMTSFN